MLPLSKLLPVGFLVTFLVTVLGFLVTVLDFVVLSFLAMLAIVTYIIKKLQGILIKLKLKTKVKLKLKDNVDNVQWTSRL